MRSVRNKSPFTAAVACVPIKITATASRGVRPGAPAHGGSPSQQHQRNSRQRRDEEPPADRQRRRKAGGEQDFAGHEAGAHKEGAQPRVNIRQPFSKAAG